MTVASNDWVGRWLAADKEDDDVGDPGEEEFVRQLAADDLNRCSHPAHHRPICREV